MVELQGFAPDLDPVTPGIMLSCDNIFPTLKGFEPVPTLVSATDSAGAVVIGSIFARFLDSSTRVVIGTATTLFENVGISWVDVSSTAYSTASGGRWRFGVFGNHIIATNLTNNPQYASQVGSFADLPDTPPRAKFVEVVNQFVFLFNTEFASNQWWCSGIGSDFTWVPDIATQAANDTLDDTEGPLTGGKRLGANIVMFKLRSMYLGQYVGPPYIWGFQLVSNETGCASHEAVVSLGDRLVFPGYQDFYSFAGSRPEPIPTALREFFFEEDLDQDNADKIIGVRDQQRGLVIWYYPSVAANPKGSIDSWIAWHPQSNKWTMGRRRVEYVMLPEYPTPGSVAAGVTYDGYGSVFLRWDDPNAVTWDAPTVATTPRVVQAIFGTDHALYTFTGIPGPSYFITGDMGDDLRFSYLTRVKPKYSRYPVASTVSPTYGQLGTYYTLFSDLPNNMYDDDFILTAPAAAQLLTFFKVNLGDTLFAHKVSNLAEQGWFNVRKSARFHRFKFVHYGDFEMIGFEPILQDGGAR